MLISITAKPWNRFRRNQIRRVSTYLQTLAGLGGILRPKKHGREMYYINDALFAELVK